MLSEVKYDNVHRPALQVEEGSSEFGVREVHGLIMGQNRSGRECGEASRRWTRMFRWRPPILPSRQRASQNRLAGAVQAGGLAVRYGLKSGAVLNHHVPSPRHDQLLSAEGTEGAAYRFRREFQNFADLHAGKAAASSSLSHCW